MKIRGSSRRFVKIYQPVKDTQVCILETRHLEIDVLRKTTLAITS